MCYVRKKASKHLSICADTWGVNYQGILYMLFLYSAKKANAKLVAYEKRESIYITVYLVIEIVKF